MSRAECYNRYHVKELAKELKQKAWMLEKMPDGMIGPEQRFFTTIRNISFLLRSQRLTKEQAVMEAREAERAFEQDIFSEELYRSQIELWRRIEAAGTNYAKYRNQKNADAFYATVYNFRSESCFKSISDAWEETEEERWVKEYSEEPIKLQDTILNEGE